jgi:hypothetical protein
MVDASSHDIEHKNKIDEISNLQNNI